MPCPSPGSRLPLLPSPPPGSRLPLLPSPSPRSGLSIQYIILPLSVLIENKPSFVSHIEVCSVLHLGSYYTCYSTIWPRMDPADCNPFITNCSILFALQPQTFASEQARVAFAINHLTGRARRWGTAEWERQTAACSSFQAFTTELRKVFGIASLGPDVTGSLMSMSQGEQTVVHYAIEFRIRARQSCWNEAACCDAYLRGLGD